MEITGKITHALEVRSGTARTTGNPWMSQSFVIETHDQYPRRCVFDVFGEDRLKEFNIQVGEELTVSFDLDAREYQGRWFNSVRAWKVERRCSARTAGRSRICSCTTRLHRTCSRCRSCCSGYARCSCRRIGRRFTFLIGIPIYASSLLHKPVGWCAFVRRSTALWSSFAFLSATPLGVMDTDIRPLRGRTA